MGSTHSVGFLAHHHKHNVKLKTAHFKILIKRANKCEQGFSIHVYDKHLPICNMISLHTHICDAGARSSVKILLSKAQRIPYSWQRIAPLPGNGNSHLDGLQVKAYQEYPAPSPPLPQNWNLSWRTSVLILPRMPLP